MMRNARRRRWAVALGLTLVVGCGRGSSEQASTSAEGTLAEVLPSGQSISATEARAYLASHTDALVLDVRDAAEWNDDLGHIEGARQIPVTELPNRIGELSAWSQKPVVVVCRVGVRSALAARMLRGAGFRQVMNLEGGMEAWRQAEAAAR